MELSELVRKNISRRKQFLFMLYELSGGTAHKPVAAEREAAERLQMGADEFKQLSWQIDRGERYTAGYSNPESMALSPDGIEEIERMILEIGEPTLPAEPVLALAPLADNKISENRVARLVGEAGFESVNRDVGTKQFFFLRLLFASKHAIRDDGGSAAIVTESQCVDELLVWEKLGLRKLAGEDRQSPANRIKKDWHDFKRRLHTTEPLHGLFFETPETDRGKVYCVRLPPAIVESRIDTPYALLSRATTKGPSSTTA